MTDTNQLPPSEREAFEAFAQNCPMGKYSIARRGDGYDSSHTQLMWDAWQARATLALRPERVQMTPASRDVIMATRTANADADEWPEPWAYQRGWNDAEAHHVITAQAKEAEAQQPDTGEPVAWPLRARVWKRESTQEWVLEIAGTLGDTDMNIRHTQPLSVAYENVPGLPTIYTHPAPSAPSDVMRDEERYRWLRDNGVLGFSGAPSWRVSVSFDAMDAYAQTLDSNIDAAMLAAK
jgi:hypothetical protein